MLTFAERLVLAITIAVLLASCLLVAVGAAVILGVGWGA